MAEKSPAQRQRQQRLARQLRENLKRRKAQVRGRAPQRRTDPPATDKRGG